MNGLFSLPCVTEPDFKVGLTAAQSPQFTDDPTELLCEVTNLVNMQDGRLGVTWSYSNKLEETSQTMTTIASIDQHGVLVPGDLYQQQLSNGNIAVTRRGLGTFRLQLLHTQDKDMGLYSCSVAAWTRGHQGQWSKAKELKSTPVKVQWSSKSKYKFPLPVEVKLNHLKFFTSKSKISFPDLSRSINRLLLIVCENKTFEENYTNVIFMHFGYILAYLLLTAANSFKSPRSQ